MNFATMTLTITKDFEDKANIPESEEYKILQQFQKDFPGLKVINRTHKTPVKYKTRTGEVLKRNKTKGLTYEMNTKRHGKFFGTA